MDYTSVRQKGKKGLSDANQTLQKGSYLEVSGDGIKGQGLEQINDNYQ